MYKIVEKSNQIMGRKALGPVAFFMIGWLSFSVLYVNAGEGRSAFDGQEKGSREMSRWTRTAEEAIENGIEDVTEDATEDALEDAVEDAIEQETRQFRMANEDAILCMGTGIAQYNLSEKDYEILTRIVEAEATGLDEKSKILVANVVLNRVRHEDFPDTIEEVVFQKVKGAVQFSPVADGRYEAVNVTESTIESVERALAGEDYSKGALFFMNRSLSSKGSVEWFDRYLTKLFVYEEHEFFR